MNILQGKLWVVAIRMLTLILRAAVRQEHVLSKFFDYAQLAESEKFVIDIDNVVNDGTEALNHLKDYFGI